MDPCIVQFFLGDFRPLARDTHGNVLDVVSTQVSPSYLEDFLLTKIFFYLELLKKSWYEFNEGPLRGSFWSQFIRVHISRCIFVRYIVISIYLCASGLDNH